ncbi:hypothetical protein B0J12DRAFT_753108 [Macrophomina phaseolina]|uniref:Short-chain dehydrogenase/reductase SDR n=1 Tax=Macrophomina phaseolina TaxID=35725 RepID=A0ABQ8FPN5_9PEZI|nr:hypothetical protein B0J12DRAFT_753108 [Macrophomina phaseolina]
MSQANAPFKHESTLTSRHKSYNFIAPEKFKGSHAGKVVFITGGGRGLGKAMAMAFAAAGASIAVLGRSETPLKETASEIQKKYNAKVISIVGDVTDPAVPEAAIAECKQKLGEIDILINNAGQGRFASIEKDDMDKWWSIYELNVKGPINFMHAVLPGMRARKTGIIFNIASDAGVKGVPFTSAYSSAKTAIIRVSQMLSWEVQEHGIQVYSIHPGTVATNFAYVDGLINFAELDENPQMKMMLSMREQFLEDDPELSAHSVVALAALEEVKALNGRYIDCTKDIGELLEGVRAGKLTPDMSILTIKAM